MTNLTPYQRITVAIAARERDADRMNDPVEWIDDARTKIAALHGQRLALCVELLRYVLERLRPWSGRGLDLDQHPADAALAAMLGRSTNAYWATLELCRVGLAEEAAKLNRSLFEDMVDVHWTILNEELAVERLRGHLEHGELLMAERRQEFPNIFDLEDGASDGTGPGASRRARRRLRRLRREALVGAVAPQAHGGDRRNVARRRGALPTAVLRSDRAPREQSAASCVSRGTDRSAGLVGRRDRRFLDPSERHEAKTLIVAYWVYWQLADRR